jgi:hypothetical protein
MRLPVTDSICAADRTRCARPTASAAFTAVFLGALLAGCVARTPYPSSWDPHSSATEWCEHPSGAFASVPTLSTLEATDSTRLPLELKEVFFANTLNGFDVTHLSFESDASGDVVVRPWVGDRLLKEEARVERSRRCRGGAWRHTWSLQPTPAGAMAGLFYTGGILLPMAEGTAFEFALTGSGNLSMHLSSHVSGTAFLFFPMRTRMADEWLLYPRWTGSPASAQDSR